MPSETCSLVVVARNEEERIPKLLESVKGLVNEFVLLDNGSTDRTVEIARRYGARVLYEPQAKGYPDWLYNRAIAAAKTAFVLLLDADEYLTYEGQWRIQCMLSESQGIDIWRVPRVTIITPDDVAPEHLAFYEHHPRLFRRDALRYPDGDRGPHQVAKPVGRAKAKTWEHPCPFFMQVRSGREQLRRDQGRGQYPDFRAPEPWEKIDGWFDFQGIYDLAVENARPGGVLVEVGSWLGKSTAYLGQRAKESGKGLIVYAVDHFRGSDEPAHQEWLAQGKDLFTEFSRNMDRAGLLGTVRPICGDSARAAGLFDYYSCDFVFIDACHGYEEVKRDIDCWRDRVRPGGMLGGHDYSDAGPQIMRAVNETFDPSGLDLTTSPGSWLKWIREDLDP